jgi:hypothetical protein
MARKLDVLDQLRINEPCAAKWGEMQGNDEVRFCGHCAKNVHNLSAMTRVDALRLVEESRGGLCIRYETTTAGSVFTRDNHVFSFPKLRLSPLAAAAFGIAITVTPAFAQENASPACTKPEVVTIRKPAADSTATVRGRLSGRTSGSPIGWVKIQLVQGTTVREVTTNDKGEFVFENLPVGAYRLTTEPTVNFKPFTLNDIEVHSAEIVEIAAQLPRNDDEQALIGHAEAKLSSSFDPKSIRSLPGTKQYTSFFNAATTGDVEGLRQWLKMKYSVDALSLEHETALVYAVRARKVEAVKFLLENKADPNVRSLTGRTTLMLAAMNGDAEIIRLLLKHGADRKLTDNDGRTAVTYAMKKEIADLLDTSNTK